jgi:dihydrodipicolinate synthase/N-acetylneuraminate lyase
VKAGLAMMGRLQNVVRLPLVPITDEAAGKVRAALTAVGAIS